VSEDALAGALSGARAAVRDADARAAALATAAERFEELVRVEALALEEAGAVLVARDYEIGHWIAPEEIEDAMRFVEGRGEDRRES